MNKIVKRTLIGLAFVIGLVVLMAGYFGLRFYLGTRDMSPHETSPINDSVFCVKDRFVNAFLFKGKEGYLMIDAGMDENNVKEALAKLGIDPSQVTDILLTHCDGDHIGSIALFRNARVYMHKDEEQMINGKNGKFPLVRFKWKFGPYILFNSNDSLNLQGMKIRVYHTPGHTPGSCCFLIGKDYLATGDNVIPKDGKYDHFVGFFNMDTKIQETAIKSLPAPNTVRSVLTAHNGVINN